MRDSSCPGKVEPILEILDSKWMLLLLFELFNGVRRFGELRRKLEPISPKTLTDRLRLLEEKGIVTRRQYPGVPLHVEYELTASGQGLQPIFAAMWAWTQQYGAALREAAPEGAASEGAASEGSTAAEETTALGRQSRQEAKNPSGTFP